jgi:hypothetical protein
MKRSTLAVIAAFVVLLAGALWVTSQRPERGIARFSFDVSKDAVDRLVFTGKNPVELKKSGAVWKLANGRLADVAAVNRLVDALATLKSSDQLTADSARFAEYELDAEKGTKVTVYAGSSKVAELTVGKPVSGGVAMLVGGQAFKVGGTSPGVFAKPAGAWIEHRLFDDKLDDASRLDVKLAGAAPWALVKKDGAWVVEDPKALPAGFRYDAEAARSLVSSLVTLRARDFEDKDPGAEVTGLGEGDDVLSITFTPAPPASKDEAAPVKPVAGAEGKAADAKPTVAAAAAEPPKPAPPPVVRTVRLGKAKGDARDAYARVDGRDDVFTLFEANARALRKTPVDLRDLKLTAFEPPRAQKLAITAGKLSLSFAKKDGAWQLVSSSEPKPAGFELDPAAVERKVVAVASARGVRLADAKERVQSGLEAPSARVTVALEGGATATLLFGKEIKDGQGEVAFARGSADAETYLVSKWIVQNLTSGLASFKKSEGWGGGGGMPNIDPSALSNLPPDVRESLMRQLAQKQREQQMLKQAEAQMGKAPPAPAKK